MGLKDIFGGNLPRDQVADGKLVANPSATIAPNVENDLLLRNGKSPSATAMNKLNEAANTAALYRGKEYASFPGFPSVLVSAGAGDRARFRFAFKSGTYAHAMGVVVLMAPANTGTDQPARVRLDIATSAAGTPAVLSQEFVYGASGSLPTILNNFKTQIATIDGIVPNTEYFGTFFDVDNGRLVSATCFELPSLTENADGYLTQNLAAGSAVLNLYRSNLLEQTRAVWKTCAAKLFNWSVDNGATGRSTTSATARNVIDDSSTTVTTATPGPTLDLRFRARASQTSGVPCVMKVYGHREPGGSGGTVTLKDSGGVAVATITGFTSTAGWLSTTFNLPATQAKYDLHYSTAAGTLSVYACSIWQQG